MAKNEWTPYGLEAIRAAHLRRRRLIALLVALGLAGIWALMFGTTTTTEQEIFANGKKANGIEFDIPDEKPKKGPVTVSLSPGQVVRADTAGEAPTEDVSRPSLPVFTTEKPYNWLSYILMYGPWILIGAGLWALGKKRGKHDEVNYGIYKGALPLEMLTASASEHVVTKRWVRTSVFAKRRSDHLPEEVLRIERVDQEAEA